MNSSTPPKELTPPELIKGLLKLWGLGALGGFVISLCLGAVRYVRSYFVSSEFDAHFHLLFTGMVGWVVFGGIFLLVAVLMLWSFQRVPDPEVSANWLWFQLWRAIRAAKSTHVRIPNYLPFGRGSAQHQVQPVTQSPVVESGASTKCPDCGAALPPDFVICVNCGLNFKTGRRVTTETRDQMEDHAGPTQPPPLPGSSPESVSEQSSHRRIQLKKAAPVNAPALGRTAASLRPGERATVWATCPSCSKDDIYAICSRCRRADGFEVVEAGLQCGCGNLNSSIEACPYCGIRIDKRSFFVPSLVPAQPLPPPIKHASFRLTRRQSPTEQRYSASYGTDDRADSSASRRRERHSEDGDEGGSSWFYQHPWLYGTIMAVIVVLPKWHIVTGSQGTKMILKVSWSISETFVNYDALMNMPYIAAKAQYPLTIQAFEREGWIPNQEEILKQNTAAVAPAPTKSAAYEHGRSAGRQYGQNDRELNSYDSLINPRQSIASIYGYGIGTEEYGDFWEGYKVGYNEKR